MKYKGVELKVGNEFESELCIGIEYDNKKFTQDKVIKMIRKSIENMGDVDCSHFLFEVVLDDYILVKNYSLFSLSSNSCLELLKFTYDVFEKQMKNVKLYVDVHSDDWFGEEGCEYNNDSVSWNEFIENLEK